MQEPIQEIKEKLDIVEIIREYIPIQQAGKNFKANCPFHKEKTPSFMISQERQTWHCFGSCNEGGDIFSFVMKYEGVEFYEALKILAEKAGVELKRISPASHKQFGVLYDINHSAKDFYKKQLDGNKKVLEYLEKRGIKKEVLDEFEIGFSLNESDATTIHLVNLGYEISDVERAGIAFKTERKTYVDRLRGRIMFPIYNTFGKVVGFSGRIMPEFDNGNMGKYINSPETPIFNKSKILYGFHRTKSFIKEENEAILVEGQMDFLSLYQDGVLNIAAVSGTALTEHHLEVVKKLADDLVLAFDSDEAGIAAIERGIDMANALDFNTKIFILDEAKDPAEFILSNPGKIKDMMAKSISSMDFYFKKYIEGKSGVDLKKNVRAVLQKVSQIYSPIEKNRWIKQLEERTKISERALVEELALLKNKYPKKEVVSAGEPIQAEDLKDRYEKLAERVLTLAVLDRSELDKLNDSLDYFPEKLKKVYLFLKDGISGEKEIDDLGYVIQMKSSLGHNIGIVSNIDNEIKFLLREIKKEFFKKRRDELSKKIKELDRPGNEDEMRKALQEFDEISKLMNN